MSEGQELSIQDCFNNDAEEPHIRRQHVARRRC